MAGCNLPGRIKLCARNQEQDYEDKVLHDKMIVINCGIHEDEVRVRRQVLH